MRALRDYQETAVVKVVHAAESGVPECTIVASPTGSGKTVIAMEAARRLLHAGTRGGFGVHRDHLVNQAHAQALEQGIPEDQITFMKAGRPYNPAAAFCIFSVQTCKVRKTKPDVAWVMGDEFHIGTVHKALTEWYPDRPRIGFTATPQLYGGRTLGEHAKHLVVAAKPSDLVAAGHIVKPRVFVPHYPDLAHVRLVAGDYRDSDLEKVMGRAEVIGNVLEHYQLHAADLPGPTIVFAVNRTHAASLVDRFRAAGHTVAMITGATGDEERASILARVREGIIRVLVNVAVFIEGYDLPMLSCVQVARPTRSLALWMQMCGRGCRPAPGKTEFLLLDHGGNYFRLQHPQMDHPWSLERAVVRKKITDLTRAAIRQCPACFYVYEGSSPSCPSCGSTRPSRWVTEHNGALVDVTSQIRTSPLREPAQQTQDLAAIYKRRQWAKVAKLPMTESQKHAFVKREMDKFWKEVLRP